jgi:hypothetical protein
MYKIISVLASILCCINYLGQDLVTVRKIDSVTKTLEITPNKYKKIVKDTVTYGREEVTALPDTILNHKEYFLNIENGNIEKITIKTVYRQWTTILTIYYRDNKPVKFTRQSWYLTTPKEDFDIYYSNDTEVYQNKRDTERGKPYAPAFLEWCYQLLNESKLK